jgi:hypothetical protein
MDNEQMARFHLETAKTLTSPEFIQAWLAASPAIDKKRGRKPGSAPPETRCAWKLESGELCKNNQFESNSYCKMHISKIHLLPQ